YQGSHAGEPGKPAETYERINNRVKMNDDELAKKFDRLLATSSTTSPNSKLAKLNLEAILRHKTMSVVTIRNRWYMPGGDVYLKDVIKEVRKALPGMKRFHCSFCRSLVGDDNAGTSVVRMG